MTYFWVIFAKYRAMHDVSLLGEKIFFAKYVDQLLARSEGLPLLLPAFVCLCVCVCVCVCISVGPSNK